MDRQQSVAQAIGTSYRTVSAEQTFAEVQKMAMHFGITRLADITHLDTIGIPVYQCIRPNSRTLSVSQGKGLTPLEAKVAALMEAVESWHAEDPLLVRCCQSISTLRSGGELVIDVEALPKIKPHEIDLKRRLNWLQGRDLTTDSAIWVPSEIVCLDRTRPSSEYTGILQRTSIGLASGNNVLEATLHALYEIIERDCYASWIARSGSGLQNSIWYQIETLPHRACELAQKIRKANCHIELGNITNDLDVPCYQCLITATEEDEFGPSYAWGMGCHLDPEVGLLRAICEAAQVRLTLIAGSRDDLTEADYDHFFDKSLLSYFQKQFQNVNRNGWQTPNELSPRSLDDQIACCRDRLSAQGHSRIVLLDLTRKDVGISVVKLVVPGMRAPQNMES